MGAKGAVEVLEGSNIRKIEDVDEKQDYIQKKEDEYTKKFSKKLIDLKGIVDEFEENKDEGEGDGGEEGWFHGGEGDE